MNHDDWNSLERLREAGWGFRVGPPCGNPIFDSIGLVETPIPDTPEMRAIFERAGLPFPTP